MRYELRWEVIRELGSGGQGTVYHVRDNLHRIGDKEPTCWSREALGKAIQEHLWVEPRKDTSVQDLPVRELRKRSDVLFHWT
jgi:hypothetical protein